MSFLTEKELVTKLKDSCNDIIDLANYHILEEVSLGLGVADLVVSEIGQSTLTEINHREKLDIIDITIYEIVENNHVVSFDSILDKTHLNKYQARKSLKKLIESDYIIEQESKFIINNFYKLVFNKSIAIEAKLKNWKRALQQAYRYRWFADYSYVVLDDDFSKQAINNLEMFKQFNIGLITISSNGPVQKVFHPRKLKPIDSGMQKLLSETILFS